MDWRMEHKTVAQIGAINETLTKLGYFTHAIDFDRPGLDMCYPPDNKIETVKTEIARVHELVDECEEIFLKELS